MARVPARELVLARGWRRGGGAGVDGGGRFGTAGFEADVDEVRMDSDVTTGFLGADVARARWLAGVAVSLSEGEGSIALMGIRPSRDTTSLTEPAALAKGVRFGVDKIPL